MCLAAVRVNSICSKSCLSNVYSLGHLCEEIENSSGIKIEFKKAAEGFYQVGDDIVNLRLDDEEPSRILSIPSTY